jgi:uncharacterized membrane protein
MEAGFLPLAVAVVVFLVSHSLTNRPALRRAAEARVGRVGFVVLYSLLSLALLAWMIAEVVAAPVVPLWEQAPWMRWVTLAAMLPASVLAVAGLSTPNPFSIGPGAAGYDAARPGIIGLTRHPVLWAMALWAAAHLLSNGDVAGLMVFLPLLVLAVVGIPLLDGRARRRLVPELWAPCGPAKIGGLRVAAGVIVYLLMLLLHPLVIGRNPLGF